MPLGKIARNGRAAAVGAALAVLCEMAVLCLCCAPSMAQAPESSFSADVGKSLEIKADSMERDEKNRPTVFRGNALATLGDIGMTSQEIHLTYDAISDETAGKDAASMPSLNEVRGDITQIDVRGDVLVTIMRRYQAKSDVATIDVKKQQLTIGGEVVLSQGEHLIRGRELIFDFATGHFKFRNGLGNPASHHRRSALPPPGLQK
jgi:lipopolysaccharide export system protein LptA